MYEEKYSLKHKLDGTVFPWILPVGTINFSVCQDVGTNEGGNYFVGAHVKSTHDWTLCFFHLIFVYTRQLHVNTVLV